MATKTTAAALRKRRNYNAVMLALYWLADDEGLFVLTYNKAIAAEAGISPAAAKVVLAEMEGRGDITVFDTDDGISFRRIILNDHPKAEEEADFIREVYCPYGRRRRKHG
jgi:hypothetical protein